MYLVIPEATIHSNFEAAVASCVSICTENYLPDASPHCAYRLIQASVTTILLCTRISELSENGVLIVPFPVPLMYTSNDPSLNIEILPTFFRGTLRAAIDIWSNKRRSKIDFDSEGVFYRRPFAQNDKLAAETTVFLNLPQALPSQDAGPKQHMLPDLLLCAFGQRDCGLPQIGAFRESDTGVLARVEEHLSRILESLSRESDWLPYRAPDAQLAQVVTSLPVLQSPMWLSYDQWMRKLSGTSQGSFIKMQIAQPQRIDGPAGSGKTLSLVLKCLTILKEALEQDLEHHAALVVFSEETRSKIIETFLNPLDSWGFHKRERATGSRQTLTVTTLLAWSRSELSSIVGAFELSADNPSQVRQDQHDIVNEVLSAHLHRLAAAARSALSHEMRTLCSAEIFPALVRMFTQEFGVVIKGMADSSLRRYLTISRPSIGLPCSSDGDRRLVFALFERYQDSLKAYGVVDLDDVAVSHIKLLQMPLRRETQEKLAFDSVFVDEAHSFNPNELAIFFLLTRRSELPPLVVAVDLPQAIGDKGYEEKGLEEAMFKDFEAREHVNIQRFVLDEVYRCSQPILDLASSIYSQGHNFLSAVRVPGVLSSSAKDSRGALRPIVKRYQTLESMQDGTLATAESLVTQLRCSRSDVLIVFMHDSLFTSIPKSLATRTEVVTRRTDVEAEHRAQRANHFVLARPEYLHGLEFEAVVIVGVSSNEVPRLDNGPIGSGAAAVFETQRAVDLLYIALTRARRQAVLLYLDEPSFLLKDGIKRGLIQT